jgi:Ca2+-binding EF-hand superfamily protein
MNSVGCIGSSNSMVMQGMHATKRPDPAAMAETLFSKLNTVGQGYIQKSDLQNAFDQISLSSNSTSSSASVDELFSQLDSSSDGKVTKSELSDTL